jgi:putative heme-binding domain-containing protein
VQYANAPDGCLHILDMYREVIEHPASLPPEIKRHLDLTSGRDRGRLYRLAPTGYTYRPSPQLSKAPTAQLTALLEHPNAWHRETATRLLYERQDQSAVPLLKTLLRASRPTSPFARFHTIAALEGLNALTADDILIVLGDPSPEVRERAILAAEAFRETPAIQQALFAMTSKQAPRTLMQLAFTLGELPESPARLEALTQILTTAGADRWIRTAALSSLGNSAPAALVAVARNAAQPGAAAALPELADLAARRTQSADQLNTFREALAAATKLPALQVRLLQAAATANPAIATKPEFQELTTALIASARTTVEQSPNADEQADALRVLSLSSWPHVRDLLLPRLEPAIAPTVQSAALDVASGFGDVEIAGALIERLPAMSPTLVPKAREALLRRPAWAAAFLDAITAGTLPASSITPTELQRLADLPDDAVRSRAIRLLETTARSSREDVLRAYQVALTLRGDAARGQAVFRQHCSVCHQIGSIGHQVGPSLASFKNRGAEAILANVLDPNREVNPAWRDYVAVSVDGTTHNGVLISETAGSLTLRRAEAKETTLLRSDIEVLRDTGRSLMPEGLEKNIDPQGMSDLIQWILTSE